MLYQDRRRDSKNSIVIDDDCEVPISFVGSYRDIQENGPLAQPDPRSYLLSMSEFDKPQSYGVYDYQSSARSAQGHDYAGYAQPTYGADYAVTQSQIPSGLPQTATAAFTPVTPTQQYGAHDPAYYPQQHVHYSGYSEPAPRPLPEVTSYSPSQGKQGTRISVYVRSMYDFELPPVKLSIMFGQKLCPSYVVKTAQPGPPFLYEVTANAPLLTPSETVALSLKFDDGPVVWQSPSFQFGSFTCVDPAAYYQAQSPQLPQLTQKKRKLSPEASPRRSPTKKPSLHHLSGPPSVHPLPTPASPFRRPSHAYGLPPTRNFSGLERQQSYTPSLSRAQSQQFYGVGYSTPSVQTSQAPSWSYNHHPNVRSPSSTAVRTPVLPSPSNGSNPPLIRTSTIHQTPTTPSSAVVPAVSTFNPYAAFPLKAVLKIDGDLNTMADKWTADERETKRRLVQFRRSQQGSVINATFEPVTLEDRIPNSICVSCIWWEEKEECYVTSVDTISLLESLVAVRFTVEEKNRIRRNLEGFRPATVSKAKSDSEDFFKLIMGFPNPKPRNIEKDVKVFPWRILAGALKKIIGKYSASYASTAGALPASTAANHGYGIEQQARGGASPHSNSSSATSHGHAFASSNSGAYSSMVGSAGLGIAQPAVSLPDHRTTSWHTPSANYSTDITATGRSSWDFPAAYLPAPPPVLPSPAHSYPYPRFPSLTTSAPPYDTVTRFVPLEHYEDQSHQTTGT